MLGIPQKRTRYVNLAKPIMAYIRSVYAAQVAQSMEAYVKENDATRTRFVNDIPRDEGPEAVDGVVEAGRRYYAFLDSVKKRFNLLSRKAGWTINPFAKKTLSLEFFWTDAICSKIETRSYDVDHEKCEVLLVMASQLSRAAANSERETQDDIKRVLGLFKQSAGILEFLAETQIPKTYSPKAKDLDLQLLNMFKFLLLAQAQACVFEACLQREVETEGLTRVAQGVAHYYAEAHKYSNYGEPKRWLARVQFHWSNHMRHQALCWEACAAFHQSRAFLAEEKYGCELGYLEKCVRLIKSAQSLEKTMAKGFFGVRLKSKSLDQISATARSLLTKASKRLEKATKENNTIYHERTIAAKDCVPPEPALYAKPTPFEEPKIQGKDPFSSLVPAKVQAEAKKFQEDLKEAVGQMRTTNESNSEAIRAKLRELNLPGALDAQQDGDNKIPEQLLARIESVQVKGRNLSYIDGLLAQVNASRDKAWTTYRDIVADLEEEDRADQKLRQTYSGRWPRPPSKQLTAEFFNRLGTIEGYLKSAASADERLARKRKQEAPAMAFVLQSPQDIEAKIPRVQNSGALAETSQATALKVILDKLTKVVAARPKIMELVDKTVEEIEVEQTFANDSSAKVPYAETKMKILTNLDPYKAKLTKIAELQHTLLADVEAANKEWRETALQNPEMKAKSDYFGLLNTGTEAHESLSNNLAQGLKFYGDCFNEYLNPLKNQVSDWIVARDHEKKMYMSQITTSISETRQKPMQGGIGTGMYGFGSAPAMGAEPAGPGAGPGAGAPISGAGGTFGVPIFEDGKARGATAPMVIDAENVGLASDGYTNGTMVQASVVPQQPQRRGSVDPFTGAPVSNAGRNAFHVRLDSRPDRKPGPREGPWGSG